MSKMKQLLVIIGGPTACGKTAVSVELCRLIGGEVISADSMQVYRGMDIGTAKVTEEEKQGIPHFLIDELDPWEDYSAAVFQRLAKKYIGEIAERGHMPVVAGGTGFYINALIYNNDFSEEERDYSIREELTAELSEKGAEYMYSLLKEIDPKYAESVHANNIKRVLRGIEFYRETGRLFSEHNAEEKRREPFYDARIFVLNMDRERLYRRIDLRVDKMVEDGLVDEVKRLLDRGISRKAVSMQGLGYKETAAYLAGELSLDEAVYKIKRDTRHFAKRQLTWFKHQCKEAVWIDMGSFESAREAVEAIAAGLRT
ncbi:MAG: tRNA (adenosine(37)-N6)-dimethylallyltransferase MiaA [Clostridiales bacterium]|nr:tRNA (adenosine(37)-N6)-dimethylallyltransferase MiaA [Clostridiales bacterium]